MRRNGRHVELNVEWKAPAGMCTVSPSLMGNGSPSPTICVASPEIT
jgi:hypothetical protein